MNRIILLQFPPRLCQFFVVDTKGKFQQVQNKWFLKIFFKTYYFHRKHFTNIFLGIPICFPNFGPWSYGAQHGFARNSKDWQVPCEPKVDISTGDVELTLVLKDTEETSWHVT